MRTNHNGTPRARPTATQRKRGIHCRSRILDLWSRITSPINPGCRAVITTLKYTTRSASIDSVAIIPRIRQVVLRYSGGITRVIEVSTPPYPLNSIVDRTQRPSPDSHSIPNRNNNRRHCRHRQSGDNFLAAIHLSAPLWSIWSMVWRLYERALAPFILE